jgi:hypothetical protein
VLPNGKQRLGRTKETKNCASVINKQGLEEEEEEEEEEDFIGTLFLVN